MALKRLWLHNARKECGRRLTQAQAAKELNLAPNTYMNMELGKGKDLTLANICRIAKLYGKNEKKLISAELNYLAKTKED